MQILNLATKIKTCFPADPWGVSSRRAQGAPGSWFLKIIPYQKEPGPLGKMAPPNTAWQGQST